MVKRAASAAHASVHGTSAIRATRCSPQRLDDLRKTVDAVPGAVSWHTLLRSSRHDPPLPLPLRATRNRVRRARRRSAAGRRDVEGQPLAANAERLAEGARLPRHAARRRRPRKALAKAIEDKDAKKIQEVLDKHVLFVVNINPESRVKVARGPADATLQQAGWTPVLVKVVNESTVKKPLQDLSPQAGNRYSGRRRQEPEGRPEDRRAVPRTSRCSPHRR